GVSELFFSIMFQGFFVETQVMTSSGLIVSHSASANVAAAQIIWRVATYHLVVVVSGFVAALYHSRSGQEIHYANRQTFVNLQLETYDERRRQVDTLYETKQLSRKEIQKRLQSLSAWGQETGDDTIPGFKPTKRSGGGRYKKKGQDKGSEKTTNWDSFDAD
nr:hypothetical protein [Bacilli bacterium]